MEDEAHIPIANQEICPIRPPHNLTTSNVTPVTHVDPSQDRAD
jgi:hypothetical protein